MLWFAYIWIFSYNGDQYYGYGIDRPNLKGLESRFEVALGPQGPTEAECNANADAYRRWFAAKNRLNTYTRIKYNCVPMEVAKF